MNDSLSLQNVVTGFAQVKGTKDIMSNISYFFELYDDDGDSRVDREGILRISEALLFLSRRGFEGTLSPAASISDFQSGGSPERCENRDEQFLSSISAFIRRCFEYADPDHAINQANQAHSDATEAVDNFSIGDDDDEDLLDLTDPSSPNPKPSPPSLNTNPPLSPSSVNLLSPVKEKAQAANHARDPNNPLYITLPTFRMVILADEVLELFFESGFGSSFRLADAPLLSHASSSNLTTFSNAGRAGTPGAALAGVGASVGGAGAGVVPPGKGLRGMLDNIVSDGMRVAAEVKRRMDEAQRELDREARQGREEDEEEGEEASGRDRELLEGAETADVEVGRGVGGGLLGVPAETPASGSGAGKGTEGRQRSVSEASRKVVEFER